MTLWVCTVCTTKYAVGLPRCPHDGATTYTEDSGSGPPASSAPNNAGMILALDS